MEKFLVIALLISSIAANPEDICVSYYGFHVCRHSDVITSIYNPKNYQSLALNLQDFSTIAPGTFRAGVRIPEFGLGFLNSKTCSPKFIELAPASFDGLQGVELLLLNCVKFPVRSHPFRNLGTLTSLTLQKVDFIKIGRNLFSDFPHLKQLTVFDVNITSISPAIFSEISEELQILSVVDKIRVLEAKSFERFHHLVSLEVNNGQFSKLPKGSFDGLQQLKNLDLSRNGIQGLSADAFSSVPQLERLSLNTNKISQIEGYTFHHLKQLRELDLGNNFLEILPREVCINDHLEHLSLRSNRIKKIGMDNFQYFPKLVTLDLADNKIHDIDPAAFRGISLNHLSLGYNDINTLGMDAFFGLNVTSLDLDMNNIAEIAGIALRGLTAESVSLCYHQWITREDLIRWGVENNDVKRINNLCGGVDVEDFSLY